MVLGHRWLLRCGPGRRWFLCNGTQHVSKIGTALRPACQHPRRMGQGRVRGGGAAPGALLRAELGAQVGGDALATPQDRVRRAVDGLSVAGRGRSNRVARRAGRLGRAGQVDHGRLSLACVGGSTPMPHVRLPMSAAWNRCKTCSAAPGGTETAGVGSVRASQLRCTSRAHPPRSRLRAGARRWLGRRRVHPRRRPRSPTGPPAAARVHQISAGRRQCAWRCFSLKTVCHRQSAPVASLREPQRLPLPLAAPRHAAWHHLRCRQQ